MALAGALWKRPAPPHAPGTRNTTRHHRACWPRPRHLRPAGRARRGLGAAGPKGAVGRALIPAAGDLVLQAPFLDGCRRLPPSEAHSLRRTRGSCAQAPGRWRRRTSSFSQRPALARPTSADRPSPGHRHVGLLRLQSEHRRDCGLPAPGTPPMDMYVIGFSGARSPSLRHHREEAGLRRCAGGRRVSAHHPLRERPVTNQRHVVLRLCDGVRGWEEGEGAVSIRGDPSVTDRDGW